MIGSTAFASSASIESPLVLHGYISEINNHYVLITDKDKQESITIKVGWDTLILSGESGRNIALDRLDKGDEVTAYYSHIMTRSLPPQSHGYALITTPQNKVRAVYTVVKDPQKTVSGVRFLDETTNTYITIPDNISPQLQNIENGDRILVWYRAIALSSPSQATAIKADFAEH